MRFEKAAKPLFARHETFHARFGWFRKAYIATHDSASVFAQDDAALTFGVGKNMVRSIRFWANAAKIITESPDPRSLRQQLAFPTNVAEALLADGGLDPYMEHPGTWWWMHWLTMSAPCHLPVWWLLLNEMPAVEFDDEEATQFVLTRLAQTGWEVPTVSSIHKDVTAFIRTYGESHSRTDKFDDQFGSPLRELGLLSASPARRAHRLATSWPSTLDPEIAVAASFDFLAALDVQTNTVLISRLATETGGPGRSLRLGEADLIEAFRTVAADEPDFQISSAAGNAQLVWTGDPAAIACSVLSRLLSPDRQVSCLIAGPVARGVYSDAIESNQREATEFANA
jgi:Protein of unknown function (DUF4007)